MGGGGASTFATFARDWSRDDDPLFLVLHQCGAKFSDPPPLRKHFSKVRLFFPQFVHLAVDENKAVEVVGAVGLDGVPRRSAKASRLASRDAGSSTVTRAAMRFAQLGGNDD